MGLGTNSRRRAVAEIRRHGLTTLLDDLAVRRTTVMLATI